MKAHVVKLILVSAATGLMLSPLGGCAQKTVSLAPSEQTAKVEDTVNTGSAATDKSLLPGASASVHQENLAAADMHEGAGPSESLDSPPPGPDEALNGKAGLTGSGKGGKNGSELAAVYFDYDKSQIRQDQLKTIRTNAMFLKGNPTAKARIEGNCDNRGTYEYNLALGEYRAMAAKKYLVNMGVADERLTTLSYGEEKSVNSGRDESAWAEQRRDDFVILK